MSHTPAAPAVTVTDTIFIESKDLNDEAAKLIGVEVELFSIKVAAFAASWFSIKHEMAIALNSVGKTIVRVVPAGTWIKTGKDSALVSFGLVKTSNP
tara:strand:- start:44 stop:334 length:291 start_codon:yes stop_codon:yes gene_type:complete